MRALGPGGRPEITGWGIDDYCDATIGRDCNRGLWETLGNRDAIWHPKIPWIQSRGYSPERDGAIEGVA